MLSQELKRLLGAQRVPVFRATPETYLSTSKTFRIVLEQLLALGVKRLLHKFLSQHLDNFRPAADGPTETQLRCFDVAQEVAHRKRA